MKTELFFKAPKAPAITVRSVVVEYSRPSSLAFARVTTSLVLGLFYVLMAVDGLSIALLGLASFLGLVLKMVGWFLGVG